MSSHHIAGRQAVLSLPHTIQWTAGKTDSRSTSAATHPRQSSNCTLHYMEKTVKNQGQPPNRAHNATYSIVFDYKMRFYMPGFIYFPAKKFPPIHSPRSALHSQMVQSAQRMTLPDGTVRTAHDTARWHIPCGTWHCQMAQSAQHLALTDGTARWQKKSPWVGCTCTPSSWAIVILSLYHSPRHQA